MRMIIVDDDVQIREGMRDGIDWKEIGIDSVECYEKVRDALEDIQKMEVDLIITDIKMPGIDGIEFLKLIHEINREIRVILISGYADFKYAREGIRYGAKDYILKPIKVGELIRIVQDTVAEIIQRQKDSKDRQEAREIRRDEFIKEILSRSVTDRNIIRENLARYFQMDFGNYIVCAVCLCRSADSKAVWFTERIKEKMEKNCLGIALDENRVLMVCRASNSAIYNINLRYSLLQELVDAGADTAGISEVHLTEELQKGYREALTCIDLSFLLGKAGGSIYSEQEINRRTPVPEGMLQDELCELIKQGRENDCRIWFQRVKEKFQKEYMAERKEVERFVCESIRYLSGQILVGTPSRYDTSVEEIEQTLKEARFAGECIDIWERETEGLFHIRETDISGYPIDIQKAIRFVYEHYSEHISAKTVAEYMEKSENYFRMYFKNVTGTALKDFINRYRIDQAEKLLKNSTLYVYEVGNMVGFQDYVYFTKVFKKLKGYSPTAARK